jgi:uncharacterized protein YeaO (DUF488 family)
VDEEKLDAFVTRYALALADETSQNTIRLGRACIRARKHVTITIRTRDAETPPQSREEQARIMRAAVGYELREMSKVGE